MNAQSECSDVMLNYGYSIRIQCSSVLSTIATYGDPNLAHIRLQFRNPTALHVGVINKSRYLSMLGVMCILFHFVRGNNTFADISFFGIPCIDWLSILAVTCIKQILLMKPKRINKLKYHVNTRKPYIHIGKASMANYDVQILLLPLKYYW